MITRERIRQFDPLKTTLLATIPNQLITLVILLTYIVQGLVGASTGYADAYYGYYITADTDGSLAMDLIGLILLIAALVAIIMAIWKQQGRFLLVATVFFVATMLFTQSLTNNIISIILCLFGYIYLKKYPSGIFAIQQEKFIPTALFICYSVGAVSTIIQLIRYLGDLLMNSQESGFGTIPDGFEGEDVPEWITWGTNPGDTDISFLSQIAPMLIYLLIPIAAIMIYMGLIGRGSKFYRFGAGAYLLLYIILSIFLLAAMPNWFDMVSILVMPDVILSIWLIIFYRQVTVQDNSAQGHISSEFE